MATDQLALPQQHVDAPAPVPSSRLDRLLALLTVALAVLAASVPVRNSDFWQHLAVGRLLAQGEYHFGVDPFTYTTAGVYWANHSWLFDLALFFLYGALGGVGLVVLKALLVAGLAWLLMRVRREDAPGWVPPVCVALALLAMTPRLLLQPACVSFFLLALTFWLLWGGTAGRRGLLVLLLCAVWVNLDAWFLLGPLLVALFWLGGRLPAFLPASAPERSESDTPATPGWLMPASLAACLLSPHHIRAFELPVELSPVLASARLSQDVRFQRLFASPWQVNLTLAPAGWLHLAVWAYFALVALGLAAFALNRRRPSAWRLLVWSAFALLGAWQVRTVPFFAVVAAPITTLELQSFLVRRRPAARPGLVRLALLPVLLGLLVVAWTGWLLGGPPQGRRVGWGVRPDPSLQRSAETIARWHEEGRLGPEDRPFALHPDVGHYLAWFCPAQKSFLDYRFGLFGPVAAEYEAICVGLNPALAREPATAQRRSRGWQELLRERGVTYLVLSDPDPRRLAAPLRRLGRDERWPLLRIDGDALLFGWLAAQRGPGVVPFRAFTLDPERLAFGPQGAQQQWTLPPAPAEGPGRAPRPRTWWTPFVRESPPPTWESPAAALYLRLFEDTDPAQRRREQVGTAAYLAACLTGPPALPAGPAPTASTMLAPFLAGPLFLPGLTRHSPALPLLVVRAARGALKANPDDTDAYLVLARAYLYLAQLTGEAGTGESAGPVGMLRHVQAVTALRHALIRNPKLQPAHQALALLFLERNYLDASLEHRQAQLRLARAAGPLAGESAEEHSARLRRLEEGTTELERRVQERQNSFVIQAREIGSDPLAQARKALELGLAQKALEVLLGSRALLFGPPGARLQLELLLMLGRAEEARPMLEEEELLQDKGVLGWFALRGAGGYSFPAYPWLRLCQSAATGDYEEADANLAEVLEVVQAVEQSNLARVRRFLPWALATEVGLRSGPYVFRITSGQDDRESFTQLLLGVGFQRAEQADLHTLRGLLALERGDPAAAAGQFRKALTLGLPGVPPEGAFPGRPLAVAYRQRLRAAQR
jgi:hypothetical protein